MMGLEFSIVLNESYSIMYSILIRILFLFYYVFYSFICIFLSLFHLFLGQDCFWAKELDASKNAINASALKLLLTVLKDPRSDRALFGMSWDQGFPIRRGEKGDVWEVILGDPVRSHTLNTKPF